MSVPVNEAGVSVSADSGLAVTSEDIRIRMDEQIKKALDSLRRYKFWMFGYHAANWINLNRLLSKEAKQPNPFNYLVNAAIFMLSDTFGQREENLWRRDVEDFPLNDWRYEVSNDDTRLGYWEWVAKQREMHGETE
jgi:hypothetical protein